jgi:aspartate racemase
MVDIRSAVANEVKLLGATSHALLGTKPTMESPHYCSKLEAEGIEVIKPTMSEMDELQRIIFDELTLGVFKDSSRNRFMEIAERCIDQGAEVVGLCCTEFGLLLEGADISFKTVDSVEAHVKALLAFA